MLAHLDRAFWFTAIACVYTSFASLASAGFSWPRLFASALVPLFLAWIWRFTHQRQKRADTDVEARSLLAFRTACAACAVWLLSRLGEPQVATLELLATIALGTGSVAALYGLARIPETPGLLSAPRSSRSLDAATFNAVLWGVATVVAANEFLAPESQRLDPLTLDYAITAASIGSLLILIAASLRVRWLRRLELGVGDRASGALAFSLTALMVAIPAAAVNVAPPDRVLPAALLAACLCVLLCIIVADASVVSATLRATIVLVALGVPVALLTGSLARATPHQAGAIALFGSLVAILVGLIARTAARPLGPEQSRWLEAIAQAKIAALSPEPEQALAATLRALKGTSISPEAKPQLFRVDPPSVLSVNVAGTLEEQDAEAPAELYQLGEQEPEKTLRAEVLKALLVKRPGVRPLYAWFEVRKAFSATIILDDSGPLGFLLLPTGGRSDVMTLEEARSVRLLAERISGLLAITSALERARRRQLEAQREADLWRAEFQRAEAVLQGQSRRELQLATNLARPLMVAAYSAPVRLLLAEMERLAPAERVVVFRSPVGVFVESWAAALHLGRKSKGPLLCLDAALEDHRDLGRWSEDERSPVALSAGGTLFIKDAHLLSEEAQQRLLLMLTQRWEQKGEGFVPAPLVVFSLRRQETAVAAGGTLELFSSWLGKAVFELPTLAERPDDLRALILDTASRVSHQETRAPLGVDRRALQVLLDYPWPGNEAELRDVVDRAASATSGPLITVAELEAIGFAGFFGVNPGSDRWKRRSSDHYTTSSIGDEGSPERRSHRPRSRSPRSRHRRS